VYGRRSPLARIANQHPPGSGFGVGVIVDGFLFAGCMRRPSVRTIYSRLTAIITFLLYYDLALPTIHLPYTFLLIYLPPLFYLSLSHYFHIMFSGVSGDFSTSVLQLFESALLHVDSAII